MLRITVQYADAHITLKLEGTLAGPWVEELERSWKTLAYTAPGKPIRADLTDVGFIAPEGRILISRMVHAGVEMIASGCMVQAIVDEAVKSQRP